MAKSETPPDKRQTTTKSKMKSIWAVAGAATMMVMTVSLAAGQQLPRVVIPLHYNLTFTPHVKKRDFSGFETIDVRVLRKTSNITLNALGITFRSVSVTSHGATQAARVILDAKDETASLAIPRPVGSSAATIRINFTGKLNKEPHGFFQAQKDGRNYAATTFEAIHAREAFPCFDEPVFKATFSITLIVNKGESAISNGRIVSDTPGPSSSKHTLRFSRSPKMSSYLVAMAIGDFKCLNGATDGIPIRVCAPPEDISEGKFALKAAEQYLYYYDRYFAIKYPFGKLDLVSVPGFPMGAMENTAAIFFNKSALLVKGNAAGPGIGGPPQVIAHEIAHQWFGDLVTPKWWNDIWLNEGFATWMSYKAVAAWHPDWAVGINPASTAAADGQSNAPPVKSRVETPEEISNAGRNYLATYRKPAALLRMLEAYEGAGTFRAGINRYIAKYAYGNATGQDFWNAETEVSRLPINRIMPTFINQPGAPLVRVRDSCQGGNEVVTLSQRRYFSDRAAFEKGGNELWQVPVGLKWSSREGGPHKRVALLRQKEQTFRLPACVPWVYGNAGGNGYYVVTYGASDLRNLARSIETNLTPAERVALVTDESALLPIGKASIAGFMNLANGLRGDRSAEVIWPLIGQLSEIDNKLVNDKDRASYQGWARWWLKPLSKRLGWEPVAGENAQKAELRPQVLWALGSIGRDQQTLIEARNLANGYLTNPSSLDPSLVDVVLNLAALSAGSRFYDELLARARSEKRPASFHYWLALPHFDNPALVRRTLDYALSPEAPYKKYIFDALQQEFGSRDTRGATWDWLKAHWSSIEAMPNIASPSIRLTGHFCDREHEADIRRFFTAHPVPGGDQALAFATKRVAGCSALRSRQGPELGAWLSVHESLAHKRPNALRERWLSGLTYTIQRSGPITGPLN